MDDRLSAPLLGRVLQKLGLETPPTIDPAGLFRLYGAWCRHVPFDNVAKTIHLFAGRSGALPGDDPADFLSAWLEHGTGGTCWSSSGALFAVFHACGFDVRRVSASMGDSGDANHGSVVARTGGADWLVDSSMVTGVPLPLDPDRVHVGEDPLLRMEVEPVGGTFRVWLEFPPRPALFPCRILEDPVDAAFYRERHERSRQEGPFNQRLYFRRNLGGEVRVVSGRTLHVKRRGGVESRDLDARELLACLVDLGLSWRVVDDWAGSGALAPSMAPPTAVEPPRGMELPPSERAR